MPILSEGHKFAHHPSRKLEHIDNIDVNVGANGGLVKLLKLVSPLAAKAGICIKKSKKEEQKFEREVQPPNSKLEHEQRKAMVTIELRFLFKGISQYECIGTCCLDM